MSEFVSLGAPFRWHYATFKQKSLVNDIPKIKMDLKEVNKVAVKIKTETMTTKKKQQG